MCTPTAFWPGRRKSCRKREIIFIFCKDPHHVDITVDKLLEAVRKAKLYTLEKKHDGERVNAVALERNEGDSVLKAIESLRDSLNAHIQCTNDQFREQCSQINAITNTDRIRGNNSVKSQYEGVSNNNRRDGFSESSRNSSSRNRGYRQNRGDRNSRDDQGNIICYKCGQPNHYARYCTASSLNS